ncbi:MAG: hypothetical protein JWR26_2482 [Pedosphaera sp.]|nr:hypothetical protein [Pedosphaera sp.]
MDAIFRFADKTSQYFVCIAPIAMGYGAVVQWD